MPQDRPLTAADMMERLPFSVRGTPGWMDRETADGRTIAAGAISAVEWVPLLALYTRAREGGHAGQKMVGWVNVYRSGLDPLELLVSGSCDNIAPGRYPCGLDLAEVEGTLDGIDVAAWVRGEQTEEEVGPVRQRITSARVIGVTVYLPASGMTGAFPDAYVEVLR